jgi:hypothetical protein
MSGRSNMDRVEAYRGIREMTPEVLLELTQSHKLQAVKKAFKKDVGLASDLLVTEEEIEAMGETLKMVVFYVSPAILRSTMELAYNKGVLAKSTRWL